MSNWPCLSGVAAERGPSSRWTGPGMLVPALAAAMILGSCSLDDPVRARREFTVSASAEGVARIEVHNRVGAIRVKGYDGADVQVGVLVKVRAGSDERAAALAEKVQVRSAREGETLKLSSLLPDLSRREQIEVELDVSVPWRQADGAAATTKSLPARAVLCEMVVGVVEVREVPAAVGVDVTTGTITIEKVTGPVEAESQTGTVKVRQIDEQVTVTGGTGSITVADVRGAVRANLGVGRIDIRNVALRQAGESPAPAVSAEASTGSISIQDVTGRVEASAHVGQVTVRRVRGAVDAHSALGEVILDRIEEPVGKN